MKLYIKLLSTIIITSFLLMMIGCARDTYVEVPRKYIGVKQISTGFEMDGGGKLKIYTSGQLVNLGKVDRKTKFHNKLILVEIGVYTKKEPFVKESPDKDHRITLGDQAPLTVDVRYKVNLSRNNTEYLTKILGEMKSKPGTTPNTEIISLMSVYDTYAGMDCRPSARIVFAGFKNFETLNTKKNKEVLNNQLYAMADTIFQRNSVPLTLTNVTASNIQQDKKIVQETAQLVSVKLEVAKIDSMGKACKRNGIPFATYYQINKTQEMVNKISESGQQATWVFGLEDLKLAKGLKK